MKTKTNYINGLDALNNEIKELHHRKKYLEHELEQNWDHLKHHFPSMLRYALFKKAKEELHKSWPQTLFSIPKVQEAVGNTLQKVSAKIEEVFLHWLDKAFVKKD